MEEQRATETLHRLRTRKLRACMGRRKNSFHAFVFAGHENTPIPKSERTEIFKTAQAKLASAGWQGTRVSSEPSISSLAADKVSPGLSLPDYLEPISPNEDLGRSRSRVVAGREHKPISPYIHQSQELPGSKWWQRNSASKAVSCLANRTNDIGWRGPGRAMANNGKDTMGCAVQSRTQKIIHSRIDHNKPLLRHLLFQDDTCQENARRADNQTSWLENDVAT